MVVWLLQHKQIVQVMNSVENEGLNGVDSTFNITFDTATYICVHCTSSRPSTTSLSLFSLVRSR